MSLPHPCSPSATERHPPSRGTRHHPQPPRLLTTTFGNARHATLGAGRVNQTPTSTTSLSSPFSAQPQSAYPSTPTGAMRGTSPMTLRSAAGFATAYNPQQWGPLNNTSPNSGSISANRASLPPSSRVTALAPRPVGPDGQCSAIPNGSN